MPEIQTPVQTWQVMRLLIKIHTFQNKYPTISRINPLIARQLSPP